MVTTSSGGIPPSCDVYEGRKPTLECILLYTSDPPLTLRKLLISNI